MNKIRLVLFTLIVGAVLLSACAPSAATSASAASKSSGITVSTQAAPTTSAATKTIAAQISENSATLDTSYDNAVSVEMQLLLGTLKLQDTDLAVTAEQASTLLPLWNNVKTISQSMQPGQGQQADSTEAQAQLTALADQIQAVMTPNQLTAIAEMKITRETAMTIMQEQGITLGGPQQNGALQRGTQSSNGNNPPPQGTLPADGSGNMNGNGGAGALPNGQPPSGGQQPGNGQPPSDGQQAGPGQMPTAPAGGSMMPPELIDVLIQVLDKAIS